MESLPYSQIEKGTFLIASPDVEGGVFFRTVVLICEHSSNGSFGIVINKNLDIDLPPEIIDSKQLANQRVGIRAGGPVQTNQMMLLHSSDQLKEQTLQVCEGVYLGGDLQFLQKALGNESGPDIQLCFGYSGWGAGKLEQEFLDGMWYLYPASAALLFHTAPDKLWQTLLRKMGGKYATLSMIPEDLSWN